MTHNDKTVKHDGGCVMGCFAASATGELAKVDEMLKKED